MPGDGALPPQLEAELAAWTGPPADSLALLRFVLALEQALGLEIPPDEITARNFAEPAAVRQLIAKLRLPA